MKTSRRRRMMSGLVGSGMVLAALQLGATSAARAASDTPTSIVIENAGITLQSEPATAVGPGVVYNRIHLTTTRGNVEGYQLTVDLQNPMVRVGLLHPPSVADRMPVSEMADAQNAIAGVNGDFFNISEWDHPGIPPTYSSQGPEIAEFVPLKGAVPEEQAFSGPLPGTPSTKNVLAVTADGRAQVTSLSLTGTVHTPTGAFRLTGLNQYAIPVDGIGAYTDEWGATSRLRAACGNDTDRHAPCTSDTAVVTVRQGRVTAIAQSPGYGEIAEGAVELVGREAGADFLRGLRIGQPVSVHHGWEIPGSQPRVRFAVGGFEILRDRITVDGVEDIGTVPAARTGAGVSVDGRTLYLLAVDGNESSRGLTVSDIADLLRAVGADDGVDLDGGGSTTFVVRRHGDTHVTVENRIASGVERPVPNGVGIFLQPEQ